MPTTEQLTSIEIPALLAKACLKLDRQIWTEEHYLYEGCYQVRGAELTDCGGVLPAVYIHTSKDCVVKPWRPCGLLGDAWLLVELDERLRHRLQGKPVFEQPGVWCFRSGDLAMEICVEALSMLNALSTAHGVAAGHLLQEYTEVTNR